MNFVTKNIKNTLNKLLITLIISSLILISGCGEGIKELPLVIGVYPYYSTKNVSVMSQVKAKFNQEMDKNTINTNSFLVIRLLFLHN